MSLKIRKTLTIDTGSNTAVLTHYHRDGHQTRVILDADSPFLGRWDEISFSGNGDTVYPVFRTTDPDGTRHSIRLHSLIAPPPVGMVTDHVNGDRCDCRRENLRHGTQSQNSCHRTRLGRSNRSGVIGVSYFTRGPHHWNARLRIKGEFVLDAYFDTREEAIAARKAAEEQHLGEWAPSINN